MSTASMLRKVSILLVWLVASALAGRAQSFNTIYNFCSQTNCTDGFQPYARLLQGTDGLFYGTTVEGGNSTSGGTVFKISSSGSLTTIYDFCTQGAPFCSDGELPHAGLVQGANGNFYGTTYGGGGSGSIGTVFSITSTGSLTTLFDFCSPGCGIYPDSGLALGADGLLYGTTFEGGGASSGGTAFRISTGGSLTTLYDFCSQGGNQCTDGFYPYAGLIQDSNQIFYGTTTEGGGASSYGTVFSLTPGGALTTLHSFVGTDGYEPYAGLVQGSDGNLYGTTFGGGTTFGSSQCPLGCGTVFKITPTGTLTTIYNFCSLNNCADGSTPYAGLVLGTDGNFYGATYGGGTNGSCTGCGTLFEISPSGALTTLHTFSYSDGKGPYASLIQATDGNFYGTTVYGGAKSSGTVYSLAVGLTPFVETNPTLGPVGTSVAILGTNLTGTTSVTFNGAPATFSVVSATEITTTVPRAATTGTVQVVTPSGTLSSNVPFTIINNPAVATGTATAITADGAVLNGAINPQGEAGYAAFYYGTDPTLMTYTPSCVFGSNCPSVTPNSSQQPFSSAIAGLPSGTTFYFEMVFWDTFTNHYLYGKILPFRTQSPSVTTSAATSITISGAVLNGAINPRGAGGYAAFYYGTDPTLTTYNTSCVFGSSCPSVAANFNSQPFTFTATGLLLSTTYYFEMVYLDAGNDAYSYGTIRQFTTYPTFALLQSFDGANGSDPSGGLVQGTNGKLYGTTFAGGPLFTAGTVFDITTGGTFTMLYSFCAQGGQCADGSGPEGVVQGMDGNFYGTTQDGGVNFWGTVFRITPGGILTTLYSFCSQSNCMDGAFPVAGLVQGSDGNFYGTTATGGGSNACAVQAEAGCGTVFKITPAFPYTLTTLHSFDAADGQNPTAGLVQDADGTFYGTTYGAAGTPCNTNGGCGTVFSITPEGSLTTLYTFCSQANCADGASPTAGLLLALDGNLYGTTTYGGSSACLGGCGTVFKITPAFPYTLTTLHSFTGPDGRAPAARLIQGTDGNFYGTTNLGGASGVGTVFTVSPTFPNTLTTLYTFGPTNSYIPNAALLQDTNGTFYGTTAQGDLAHQNGTVFSLSVGLGPFVATNPTSGNVGTAVAILGTNLTGATGVTFNGTAAVYSVKSKTLVVATVPTGASTGVVQVKLPGGTLSSNVPFQVLP